MQHIAIINGPNLNMLGKREPEMYGNLSFEQYLLKLDALYPAITLTYYQSNIEGELINKLQALDEDKLCLGVVLNAGAYSHTSIAIADAVGSVAVPVISVHISNIYAREPERRTDLLLAHCRGSISGFGMFGYDLAIQAICSNFDSF